MEGYRHNPEEFYDDNTLVIADITDAAKAKAADVALEKSTESAEKPKGFLNKLKNFGTNIWKRSEIYQTKERHNALNKIKQTGNLFSNEGAGKEAHEKETGVIVKRFTAKKEFEGDLIHEAAGETKTDLGNSEADQRLKTEINGLIRAYARSGDESAFYSQKAEVLARYGKGKMYADNLFKFAQKAREYVKTQVDQQLSEAEALEGLDSNFKIVIAKAKAGVRSEAQFNAVDRIVDKIQNWTGGVINEKTVAVAVATANTVFSKVVQGSVKRAAGAFGLGAVVSGAAGAARESRKIEVERMQHAREKAQGKEVKNPALAKRREELEASRIQTKKSQELGTELNAKLFDRLIGREAKDLTEAEYNQALVALADIDSRIQISDNGIVKNPKTNKWQFWKSGKAQKIDLISYSDVTKVDQERDQLDVLRARAKVELKKWAEENDRDFKNDLSTKKADKAEELFGGEKGIKKQNEIFQKLKRQKVWKAAWRGTVIGGGLGMAMQEAHAFVDSNQEGLAEHGWHALTGNHHPNLPGEKVTLAEGIRRRAMELFEHPDHGTTFVNLHDQATPGGHNFKLPEGYAMQSDGHGGYQILDHGHAITDSFKLNPDGTLTPRAKEYLAAHHFGPHEAYNNAPGVDQHITEAGRHMTLEETVAKFSGLQHHPRLDWHDEEDIPGFEGKQQFLYEKILPDGKVQFNINKILVDLSFNAKNADALSHDGMFGINPDHPAFPSGTIDTKLLPLKDQLVAWYQHGGDAEIAKHLRVRIIPTEAANKAGLSIYSEVSNHHGIITADSQYANAAYHEVDLIDDNGVAHSIATATHPDILIPGHDTLIPGHEHFGSSTVIGRPENPTDFITQPPYIIPYGIREGLEEMERVPIVIGCEFPHSPEYTSLSYGRVSPEQMRRYKERMSVRLRDNPDANLDHYEELEDYFTRMNPERLLRTRMLAGQVGEMNKDITISVNIPVAGHQEGDNIYKSLQNYTNQTIDPSKFEICLLVNHPDVDREGNMVRPDKTLSEIERFKKDYPDFNVKVMYQVLPRDEAKIGNIRKYLNDAVLWRHHQRGQEVPDLIMVSNDADNKGMAPEYLQNFSDKFEQNPMVDAFLGQMDWDPEAYINNPLMHIGTRFFQYVDSQTRRRDITKMQSSGANFAMRSSIYAAVDGYDDTDVMAEDVVLGSMIKTARYGAADPARVGIKFAGARVSRMYTNARRGLIALENGLSPIEQWQRGFSAFDHEVRGYKMAEGGLDFDDPVKCQDFVNNLQTILNRTLKVIHGKDNAYWHSTAMGAETDRALGLLGIEYEVDSDGEIGITNAEKLLEGLKKYKSEGLELMKRKIGETKLTEELSAAAKKEVSSSLKPKFEANPFSFIYRGDLNNFQSKGVSLAKMVKELFKANGFSDSDYSEAEANASKVKGGSHPRKMLMELTKLMVLKDTTKLADWQSRFPEDYRDWASDIIHEDIKVLLNSGKLTDAFIDQSARNFNISPDEILNEIYNDHPTWKEEANTRIRAALVRRVSPEGDRIVRDLLQDIQAGRVRLSSKSRRKGTTQKT